MTDDELLWILTTKLKINTKFFAFGGEIKDNATNVELLPDGKYAVYALERGIKNSFEIFDTKDEAYLELIRRIGFDLKHGFNLS